MPEWEFDGWLVVQFTDLLKQRMEVMHQEIIQDNRVVLEVTTIHQLQNRQQQHGFMRPSMRSHPALVEVGEAGEPGFKIGGCHGRIVPRTDNKVDSFSESLCQAFAVDKIID